MTDVFAKKQNKWNLFVKNAMEIVLQHIHDTQ